jgi:hypothetical protein
VQPLWKTVWRFLKKLKIEEPYDPVIPLLGIYPKEVRIQQTITYPVSQDTTDYCMLIFIAALFTTAKLWKQPTCPKTDEWMKKM